MNNPEYERVAKRLHDLGFIRLRNGTTTPRDEDIELMVVVMNTILTGNHDRDDDGSGLILNMLGMK